MTIIIERKSPLAHSLKVAAGTITVFLLIGVLARFAKTAHQETSPQRQSLGRVLTASSPSLVPSIQLAVSRKAPESVWTAALAKMTGGRKEASVKFGRADVITDNYAVEVDFLHKWKEGLGQAQHYADVTGLIPVLALIIADPCDEKLLEQIDSLCTKKGVKLIVLKSSD